MYPVGSRKILYYNQNFLNIYLYYLKHETKLLLAITIRESLKIGLTILINFYCVHSTHFRYTHIHMHVACLYETNID